MDLAAAADAAAVRWKQQKELSTWRLVKEKKKKKTELLEAGWGYRVKLTAESGSSYFRSSSRCRNAMHPWSQSPSGAALEPRAAVSLSSTKQRMTEVEK